MSSPFIYPFNMGVYGYIYIFILLAYKCGLYQRIFHVRFIFDEFGGTIFQVTLVVFNGHY